MLCGRESRAGCDEFLKTAARPSMARSQTVSLPIGSFEKHNPNHLSKHSCCFVCCLFTNAKLVAVVIKIAVTQWTHFPPDE